MISSDANPLAARERSLEEAFFRKVDAKLLDQLRDRLTTEQELKQLAADTGIHDQQVLQELLDLGITPQTLLALWLVPLTQVAWADGTVQYDERVSVLEALRQHGYREDSPAWQLLESWLDHEPSDDVIATWKDYARSVVEVTGHERLVLLRRELRHRAGEVARAAGGVFGFHPVSRAEELVLEQIDDALRPADA